MAKLTERLRGISDCITVDAAGVTNEPQLIANILRRLRSESHAGNASASIPDERNTTTGGGK